MWIRGHRRVPGEQAASDTPCKPRLAQDGLVERAAISLTVASLLVVACVSLLAYLGGHNVSLRLHIADWQVSVMSLSVVAPLLFYCRGKHCSASHTPPVGGGLVQRRAGQLAVVSFLVATCVFLLNVCLEGTPRLAGALVPSAQPSDPPSRPPPPRPSPPPPSPPVPPPTPVPSPPPSPPHSPNESLLGRVTRLNALYAGGHASNDLAAAGICVRAFDRQSKVRPHPIETRSRPLPTWKRQKGGDTGIH